MKKIISVVGPTAIGKTSLAIELALKHQTEIISCDSRQFFKELKIGSAMPSEQELETVPHHFIANKSIIEDYNVGNYEQDSLKLINNLFEKYDVLILVGGSGLYEKALTLGLDSLPDIPQEIRNNLINNYNNLGLEYLQNRLKNEDLIYFNKVDSNNPHRLIRALEIIDFTGKSILSFQNKNQNKRNFLVEKIGLNQDRKILYNKINNRVDLMIEAGLVKEVNSLIDFKDKNALKTVGYSEIFNFLDGKYPLDFAIEEIKKNTRRYAKRQLTWFKKDNLVKWIEI